MRGPRTLPLRLLGAAMCAGLVLRDSGFVEIEMPHERDVRSKATLLPFMYFPYVSWNTAVHVQILGEQMATPEGMLRLVSAEDAFARSASARVPTAQWLDAHPEMQQLAANCELHVVLSESDTESFWLQRVLCEQSGQSQLFHYNELALLVHELSAHA